LQVPPEHIPEQQFKLVLHVFPVARQAQADTSHIPEQQPSFVVQAPPCLWQFLQFPLPGGMHCRLLQHWMSLMQVLFSAWQASHSPPMHANPPQHCALEEQTPPAALQVLHCPLEQYGAEGQHSLSCVHAPPALLQQAPLEQVPEQQFTSFSHGESGA
jgi:hypothetical protein